MWPLPATMSTNYQSVVTMYCHQNEAVQQNVTTSCHNVHKLSISCPCVLASYWSSATECGHFLPQCPQIINNLSIRTGIKLKQCNQNVTTPCHNVHKLSISCYSVLASNSSRFWCESIWNGQKMYSVMNFLCFLGRRFFQVGNRIKRTMCMLIIWDDFHTELLCLTHENFFSGIILTPCWLDGLLIKYPQFLDVLNTLNFQPNKIFLLTVWHFSLCVWAWGFRNCIQIV
jgi:hypothetical protein